MYSASSHDKITYFRPPVNPEPEIDDPTDVKPSDWDEREK